MKTLPLTCQLYQFLKQGQPLIFPAAYPSTDAAIDRLVEHMKIAERNKEDWVRITTGDLRRVLVEIVKMEFERILPK